MQNRFFLSLFLLLIIQIQSFSQMVPTHSTLTYIDTSFENASPLYWEIDDQEQIQLFFMYDQERNSPNRANGHFHFRIEAKPDSNISLVFNNLKNVWNGRIGCPLSSRSICKISTDGKTWDTVKLSALSEFQYKMDVHIKTGSLYVAHVEPYRISDLDAWINNIKSHPWVSIETIGYTVQNRPIEIIHISNGSAPHHAFIRARAHPWEPGGNWVVQGLVDSLLNREDENTRYLNRYSVSIMPMANKDGVANGKTRFNMMGKDLNRDWDVPANPALSPENAALEQWLQSQIANGKKPDIAFDLHNDQSGKIHISRPEADLEEYLSNMERYEKLMRQHTWFTEGSTGSHFRNPGTIGEGLLARFGITAFVQELNCNWIEGLQDHTSAEHWILLGSQYRKVLYEYFKED